MAVIIELFFKINSVYFVNNVILEILNAYHLNYESAKIIFITKMYSLYDTVNEAYYRKNVLNSQKHLILKLFSLCECMIFCLYCQL